MSQQGSGCWTAVSASSTPSAHSRSRCDGLVTCQKCSNIYLHPAPLALAEAEHGPVHKHNNYHWFFFFFPFSHWVICSTDGAGLQFSPAGTHHPACFASKNWGDGVTVIDSVICGLANVANVQQREYLTSAGRYTDSQASSGHWTDTHQCKYTHSNLQFS